MRKKNHANPKWLHYILQKFKIKLLNNQIVPFGEPSALIRTTAFSSKRILIPLSLRKPLDILTITARTTSDFLTDILGIASKR